MNPICSVILPVYNVQKYVFEAINSIQCQSLRGIEIIVVDDASTDDTYNIVYNLASLDKRIKLFRNDFNLKIASTLNKALSFATGKYIIRMDGDDLSDVDRISTLVGFIENNPAYDIVGSSMTAIDEDGLELFKSKYSGNVNFLMRTLKYSSPLAHIWIAKREVYESLGGYRELSGVEDYDFLLRSLTSGYKITNLSEYYGYKVRVNRVGNTSDLMGLKQIKLHSYAWRLYKERLYKRKDSFSTAKVEKYLSERKILEVLHSQSNKFLSIAISNKNSPLTMTLYLLLSLISPYQLIYLKRRASFKFMSKFYNDV